MSGKALRVLLVEDNAGDARLFSEAVAEARSFQCELLHRVSVEQALQCVATENPDMIVLDLGLPDVRGLDAVRKVRLAAPAAPLVVLTGLDDEASAVAALHAGAQDYLIKGQLDATLLVRALRYAIERHRMQLALQMKSSLDELTGLANRRGFLLLAEQHALLAHRRGETFLVGFVDLNGLKQINDTLGHQGGDAAIVEAAQVLRTCCRESDILGRLGGDEFAFLLPSTANDTPESIRERIRQELSSRNAQQERGFRLSFSVGIVEANAAQTLTMEELLARADALMYEEKLANDTAIRRV